MFFANTLPSGQGFRHALRQLRVAFNSEHISSSRSDLAEKPHSISSRPTGATAFTNLKYVLALIEIVLPISGGILHRVC